MTKTTTSSDDDHVSLVITFQQVTLKLTDANRRIIIDIFSFGLDRRTKRPLSTTPSTGLNSKRTETTAVTLQALWSTSDSTRSTYWTRRHVRRIHAIDDDIILISDDDSISVEYLDLTPPAERRCSRPRQTPRHTRVQCHSTLTDTRLQTRYRNGGRRRPER